MVRVSNVSRLSVAAVFFVCSTSALAEPTKLGGDVTINAKVKNNVANAMGVKATAVAANGSVFEGTTVKGKTTINAEAKNNIANATGVKAKAIATNGSVGVPKN